MREKVVERLLGRSDELLAVSPCQTCVKELMRAVGVVWLEGLREAKGMARLAEAGYSVMGFGSVRVPFDHMVEVEALGVKLKYPSEPEFPEVERALPMDFYEFAIPNSILGKGRADVVLKALSLLSRGRAAVFSGMLGPFSITCHMFGILKVVKASVKRAGELAEFMASLAPLLAEYGMAMVEAGADVIVIEEEFVHMVSPSFFDKAIIPALQRVVNEVKAPIILHMCGEITTLANKVPKMGVAGLSIDHRPNVRALSNILKGRVRLLGNVDTYGVLVAGSVDDVKRAVVKAVKEGIDLVAPGGPLLPQTPLRNVKALTGAVKGLDLEGR